MAQAVEFRSFTPHNTRHDLLQRLRQAPEEHSEAMLAMYDLLQRLHDKGLIDMANGLLSASDTVVSKAVDVVSSKPAITATRLGLMGMNLLSNLDADGLHNLLTPTASKPRGLAAVAKQLLSMDTWRGISAGVGLLNVFGAALRK